MSALQGGMPHACSMRKNFSATSDTVRDSTGSSERVSASFGGMSEAHSMR